MANFPAFTKLWTKYPGELHPCDQPWPNQCAIRMSIALVDGGLSLAGFADPKCKHGHARGAEPLANHLWGKVRHPVVYRTAETFLAATSNKTGISFFKDIAGFRNGIGDHIDLWNKGTTKTGHYEDVCKQIWFWEVA
jgi:hypothetical protein